MEGGKISTVIFFGRKFLFGVFFIAGTVVPCVAAATLKKTDNSSITMPSMPTMPSVVMPSIGSGFYVPGSKGFYSGTNPYVPNRSDSSKKAPESGESSSASMETPKGSAPASSPAMAKALSSAGAASSAVSQLTASDLSSLDSMGLLGSIGGLLGGNGSLLNSKQNSILVNQNSQDSKLLESILAHLNEIKNQVAAGNPLPKPEETTFTASAQIEPKILRFNVNGYDLLSTCRKIYFSDQETDGTFLLTGDRKYVSENKNHSETFYFYFHACGNDGGITKYKVTPALSQDSENKSSYLYQLMQKSELEAQRTGNLVTLRAVEDSWKMDILLSLDRGGF